LPCYTASKSLKHLGRDGGPIIAREKSLAYGQTKDYVEELHVVCRTAMIRIWRTGQQPAGAKLKLPGFEGEIYRQMFRLIKDNFGLIQKAKPTTSKNSSGYLLWEVWNKNIFNLAKLITGSQGTLGLVTKIKNQVVRPKPLSELLVIFYERFVQFGGSCT